MAMVQRRQKIPGPGRRWVLSAIQIGIALVKLGLAPGRTRNLDVVCARERHSEASSSQACVCDYATKCKPQQNSSYQYVTYV